VPIAANTRAWLSNFGGQKMTKGLRTTLWVLSSLAVLWTVTALIVVADMDAMMGGMMRPGSTGGNMNDLMGGGMMMGMMLHMALTGIVMIGLVGVFIYLIVTAKRAGRGEPQSKRGDLAA
jgi:uncharacterized membrane protein